MGPFFIMKTDKENKTVTPYLANRKFNNTIMNIKIRKKKNSINNLTCKKIKNNSKLHNLDNTKKVKINNQYEHYEYLGYLLCKDINCLEKDLMIKWNAFYLKNFNEKNVKDLLVEFIKDKKENFDYPRFVFMFYSKLIIKKSDMIEILKDLQ